MNNERYNIVVENDEVEEIAYFFYSRQQQKELEDHVNVFGGRISHGSVLHEGSMRLYTEMSPHDDSRYSDAVLITDRKSVV